MSLKPDGEGGIIEDGFMNLAVVVRDFEIGGPPEEVENVVKVLRSEYFANGLQGKPFYRVYMLVERWDWRKHAEG